MGPEKEFLDFFSIKCLTLFPVYNLNVFHQINNQGMAGERQRSHISCYFKDITKPLSSEYIEIFNCISNYVYAKKHYFQYVHMQDGEGKDTNIQYPLVYEQNDNAVNDLIYADHW